MPFPTTVTDKIRLLLQIPNNIDVFVATAKESLADSRSVKMLVAPLAQWFSTHP